MASKYKTKFQDSWLSNEKYREWLAKDSDVFSAKCKLCVKTFSIGGHGETALKSHMGGKKHSSIISARSDSLLSQFKTLKAPQVQVNSPVQTSLTEPSKRSATIDDFVSKDDVLKAEVIWSLHAINNHHSFLSSAGIQNTFQLMFPDSNIAKNFSISERKAAYLATFGIAPYIRSNLEKHVLSDSYVLLFDESLNTQFQNKQMDYHVRVWNVNRVETKYFTSKFMGHATANDMVKCFEDVIESMSIKNLIQLSMDGPNVNVSFYNKVNASMLDNHQLSMLDTGSCGLHKVHGAMKAAMDTSSWELDRILKGFYKIFQKTPARREDYVSITGSSVFPLHFCSHRWLENSKSCQRILDISDHLMDYVDEVKKGKFTKPDSRPFQIVKEALQDPFLRPKLAFFVSLAKQVEPFLLAYQTDKPMLPFIFTDLSTMVIRVLRRFIKESVLDSIQSARDFLKLDVTSKSNLLLHNKVDIGFSADQMIKKLKMEKKVSDLQVMTFKDECQKALICFMKKLLEKCPLKYQLVSCVSCLDPSSIVQDKSAALSKLKKILAMFVEKRQLKAESCDQMLQQFTDFITAAAASGSLGSFCRTTDRLDEFYATHLNNVKYKELWSVVRILLLLSHGQASVERGFSINKELEDSNLAHHTLVARRLIVDFVRSAGGVEKVDVNHKLLSHAASAHAKYKMYLDEEREKKEKIAKGQKRKLLDVEYEGLQKKKVGLEADIKFLLDSSDDLAFRAEKDRQFELIIQSNSLKKRAKEKEEEVKCVTQQLKEKLLELKQ